MSWKILLGPHQIKINDGCLPFFFCGMAKGAGDRFEENMYANIKVSRLIVMAKPKGKEKVAK